MKPFFVVLFCLGMVGLVVGSIIWATRREKKRIALWTEIALAHGGSWLDRKLSWREHHRGMDIPLLTDGGRPAARLFIDTHTVSTGKSSTTFTRGRVRYPLPAGPVFKVYKEGVFSSLGKALGTQDVELGDDPAFDDRFMVKCDEPEAVRRAWTTRAQALMLTHFEDCRVDGKAEELCFIGLGAWLDRDRLGRLIELLDELGRVDFYGHGVLAGLEEARFEPVSGPWDEREPPRATIAEQGRQVVLAPTLGDHRHEVLLRATLANERPLPSFCATLGVDHPSELPEGVLNADTTPLIEHLSGATLWVTPEQLCLTIGADDADSSTLRTAARLLVQLANPVSGGAFR